MGDRYSDSKFGALRRKWFALSTDQGGDAAAGHTFGTTDATKITHVLRYYPEGPIKVVKFGGMVTTTLKNGSADVLESRLVGRGASASEMASVNMLGLSAEATVSATYDIASTRTITASIVKVGEYISIDSATALTDNGTAANTATMAGEVAYFVDYVPLFDSNNADEWSPQA